MCSRPSNPPPPEVPTLTVLTLTTAQNRYAPPGVLKIIGMGSQVLLPPGLCLPDEMGDLGDELEYLDLSVRMLSIWWPNQHA